MEDWMFQCEQRWRSHRHLLVFIESSCEVGQCCSLFSEWFVLEPSIAASQDALRFLAHCCRFFSHWNPNKVLFYHVLFLCRRLSRIWWRWYAFLVISSPLYSESMSKTEDCDWSLICHHRRYDQPQQMVSSTFGSWIQTPTQRRANL